MSKEQFVGTWKLVSMEARRSDGQLAYPYGDKASGRIIFDVAGNFAAQIMRADRPAFASGDMQNATADEYRAAIQGYLAFFGTYTVDEAASRVIMHVLGSVFPNWIDTDQVRQYQFEDNRLTLETPPLLVGGVTLVAATIWERLLPAT